MNWIKANAAWLTLALVVVVVAMNHDKLGINFSKGTAAPATPATV